MHEMSNSIFWEIKKNITDLLSPELAQRVVKVYLRQAIFYKNIGCGYSLEVPRQGASNKYPQHMFSWTNKKNIYLITSLT